MIQASRFFLCSEGSFGEQGAFSMVLNCQSSQCCCHWRVQRIYRFWTPTCIAIVSQNIYVCSTSDVRYGSRMIIFRFALRVLRALPCIFTCKTCICMAGPEYVTLVTRYFCKIFAFVHIIQTVGKSLLVGRLCWCRYLSRWLHDI